MQDDPDPDAIASALALKTLLGRTRTSAPICTFGTITRPENVAMCKILDIEVEAISAEDIAEFDRVAMVDVQPSFLEERFEEVDLVIDHHPMEQPIDARIKDVRPSYGATSTILVEYLRAADVKITQRLATRSSTASRPTPSASSAAAPRRTWRRSRISICSPTTTRSAASSGPSSRTRRSTSSPRAWPSDA